MSKICEICGKGSIIGHNVSHANNKTKKIWYPNLHPIRLKRNGGSIRLKICTSCLSSKAYINFKI